MREISRQVNNPLDLATQRVQIGAKSCKLL